MNVAGHLLYYCMCLCLARFRKQVCPSKNVHLFSDGMCKLSSPLRLDSATSSSSSSSSLNMSSVQNCCEWCCTQFYDMCSDKRGLAVASTEYLLSQPLHEIEMPKRGDFIRRQLFNRHGFNLAIFQAHVKGVREAFHPNSVLDLIPVDVGQVQILGVEANAYLAMNNDGSLYVESDQTNEATVFIEKAHGHYLIYLSKKFAHLGWYLGLKKTGSVKNAQLTVFPWGQKAIQFVARKPYAPTHSVFQLENLHRLYLSIGKDGCVKGLPEKEVTESSQEALLTLLEFIPTSPPGAYWIRSVSSGLYLAIDAKGKVYGEPDRDKQGALFAEHSSARGIVLLSVPYAHLGWHVGIRKSGKVKTASHTWHPVGQKAVHFIRRPVSNSAEGEKSSLSKTFEDLLPALSFIDDEAVDGDYDDDDAGQQVRESAKQIHKISQVSDS